MENESTGTLYSGCSTPLGFASLRAFAYGSRLRSLRARA